MPRERDRFWMYGEPLANKKWRCSFCGMDMHGSATRVKAHLAGIGGHGIRACAKVSSPVREAASQGMMMGRTKLASSERVVLEEMIQGNSKAALTSTSHAPLQSLNCQLLDNTFQAPKDIINTPGMPKGTLVGASSSQYDQTAVLHSNEPLPSRNEVSGTETGSIPLQDSGAIHPLTAVQPTRGPLFSEATHVNLQVMEHRANMASPSSSQVEPASVPPQHQSVLDHLIYHKKRKAPQNPTMLSSSLKEYLVASPPQPQVDKLPRVMSLSQGPDSAPPPPMILPCGIDLRGPSSLPELDMNEGAPMMSHPNAGNSSEENGALKRKRLCSRDNDINKELKYASSLSLKKHEFANCWMDGDNSRNDFPCVEVVSENCSQPHERLDIVMQEAEDLKTQGNYPEGPFKARETKVSKLLEQKLVGEAFQRNSTKILEYLVEGQMSRLGIYGMGGVGKTAIMVHIYNRLLENYHNVLWITVSQNFSARNLQDIIWEALSLGTLQEKDARKRAAMLFDCLTKRGKYIILLDDVWEVFDLEEVGIPVRADGIKLVLTTRSFGVCCQMHCQGMIKIEPLSREEAESLFLEKVGPQVALNLETEAVVKSVVKECAGLPLGVITIARSMRGVTNVFEWKDTLVKLKESDMSQTNMENVIMSLKLSYNFLGNHEVQQCFLSCALYPEDKLIEKLELIEFFIDQGLIGGLNTIKEQYYRGLTILNKLKNVCLLEDHGTKMKMHDLIRDMALHIMSETSIVKAAQGLKRIPPEEYWMDTLEKVSLMENDIRKFPLNMSPNCPKLSTFLLNRSLLEDVVIPDSFFINLRGLKLLNLSGCKLRELPNSISDLVNLRALLLRECEELCRVPYLGRLRSLRKLDICGCVHLEALEGLEMMVNLRYLDLTDTHIKILREGTLGNLLYLQYLRAWVVNGEDIANLQALETLKCCFEDVDDFNKSLRVAMQISPCYYILNVDQEESYFHVEVGNDARFGNWVRIVHIRKCSHAIVSMGGEHTGICILIPQDVQTLIGKECDGTTNLSSMGPLENLESLDIEVWRNLRVLCGGQDDEIIDIHDSLAPISTPLIFPSLRILKISQCPKLKYLFGHESKFCLPHLREIELHACEELVGIIAATSQSLGPSPAFPSLEEIHIVQCDKVKRMVESNWLPHFSKLKSITVSCCANMEEIIGPPPYMPVGEIYLEFLDVRGCNNMRRLLPYDLLIHLLNLKTIQVDCCKGMVEMISGAGQGQEGSLRTPVNNAPSSFEPSISLPKLEVLRLYDLPQLKSICKVPILCDSMKNIQVCKCPELNRIPLGLRLRDIENLPFIKVEDKEKWKTLIWDHPNAQAILQPLLLFSDGFCVLQRHKSH